jgi:hypothetical protein
MSPACYTQASCMGENLVCCCPALSASQLSQLVVSLLQSKLGRIDCELQLVSRLDADMSWLCILCCTDERHVLPPCPVLCIFWHISVAQLVSRLDAESAGCVRLTSSTPRTVCCAFGVLLGAAHPIRNGACTHIQLLAHFKTSSRMPHCLLRVPTCSWCRGWTLT